MKTILHTIIFLIVLSVDAQISPLTAYDWTIEKIETFDGTTILADPNPSGLYDKLIIEYSDFLEGYVFVFSGCDGEYIFDDSNQEFDILFWGCIITPNNTDIADHFILTFIFEEGGLTETDNGPVYGPFSYDFTYSESGDIVYLHITNLEGSVATFYASTLGQEEFLKKSITIYPSPATDVIKIESSGVAIDNIKIYDLKGRLVEETKINGEKQINVSRLPKGIYILHIETAVGVLSKKLIKQ